jgi:hypothetical protein
MAPHYHKIVIARLDRAIQPTGRRPARAMDAPVKPAHDNGPLRSSSSDFAQPHNVGLTGASRLDPRVEPG